MRVQAAPGLKVPREGAPRQYITTAVEVPATAYYRRLVSDGSLQEVPPSAEAAPSEKSETSDQSDPSVPAEAQSEGGSDSTGRATKKKEL